MKCESCDLRPHAIAVPTRPFLSSRLPMTRQVDVTTVDIPRSEANNTTCKRQQQNHYSGNIVHFSIYIVSCFYCTPRSTYVEFSLLCTTWFSTKNKYSVRMSTNISISSSCQLGILFNLTFSAFFCDVRGILSRRSSSRCLP